MASPSNKNHRRLCPTAPDDYGLLITLDDQHTICRMELVPDAHLDQVHPNAYGPSALTSLCRLGGGGSGVRVFKGYHPVFGSLVMKHGGCKDTKELFALATVAQELKRRNSKAAVDMQSRIPNYCMVYVSPHHLRATTPQEQMLSLMINVVRFFGPPPTFYNLPSVSTSDPGMDSTSDSTDSISSHPAEKEQGNTGTIHLYARTHSTDEKLRVSLHSRHLDIVVGQNVVESKLSIEYGDDGFEFMKAVVDKLAQLQEKRLWKYTLGQTMIGGPSPITGASYLARGMLQGELLETLICEYVKVIRNLQSLTLPEERDAVDLVRQEVHDLNVYSRPTDISQLADAFVGFNIRKNWHPARGRFYTLRRMGADLRHHRLALTQAEKLPARLLGILLQPKSLMSHVFEHVGSFPTALDTKGFKLDTWRVLLRDAVSLKCSAGCHRVWNCGLDDGGLHNLFLSQGKVWFFDLGEPTHQPLPGLLTKFLFSFLHTLGMVDDKVNGGWVNRFIPGEKLRLTEETEKLLPKAYDAFKTTIDRLIEILFDGEEAVRGLLINYITLQLLSDAAFCMERWTIKGGGTPRYSNHNKSIEQWLWRALWDLYVASDLNTKRRLNSLGVKSSGSPIHGADC